MNYNYRYRLSPTDDQRETLAWTLDTCRQVYNHFLKRLNDADGVPSEHAEKNTLPDLKQWWTDLNDVYSKVLQTVVERVYHNLDGLSKRKEQGYGVGRLRWKPPRAYRSFTYNQSGFKLDNKSGRTVLSLSKIGEIPIRRHRPIPEDATIKQVTVKEEPTGEWYATFGIELDRDSPAKPEHPERCVGIDVGILTYAHDTDGTAVESLDLTNERERLERAQRNLSRKEHGSANWEKQRRIVADHHAGLKQKRRDFLHKLSNYYATEYDFVAVEDLDAKGLIERPGNSRTRASAAWGAFRRMLEYKCEREGTHFVAVDPAGTSKECARCGVETEKPLWVREHSCPACGFEADRDGNAAINILSRGLQSVGEGRPESTPVETVLPTGTTPVPAKHVIETGSPCLKEPPSAASRPG